MFRKPIRHAYDDRCAVTGLSVRDPKGRSVVEAAHIWAVGDSGPDPVVNGLAIWGTVHWFFDHHLIRRPKTAASSLPRRSPRRCGPS